MTTTALVHSIDALRARLEEPRRSGAVGFVPTMGALHAGHARLMERARRDCDTVVVSIFVNPLQFDREDDLRRYPRPMQQDLDVCAEHGVDAVFAPEVSTMYPVPLSCTVDVGPLAEHLCGRHRPGHFRGVATVVLKLLQIVQPHRAYFGEKDAQQLAIVRRLVRDLNVPVAIVGVPTVREADGLALSSRNQQLTPEQRALAPVLYQALCEAERTIASGVRDVAAIASAAAARIPQHPMLRLEYLEIVDADNLQPVESVTSPVIVAGALWAGSTRLIDNVPCTPSEDV
jgi:pantoate--beta-alanine ligase